MNCKRIQELIVTDYIDGEASPDVQERIKAHIGSCARCRAFEQAVLKNGRGIMRGLEPVRPPQEVWQRIQEALRPEQQLQAQEVPSYLERLSDLLRENFLVRRPAYAFATAFTVVLIAVMFAGTPLRRHMAVRDYLSQKAAFMVALDRASNGELDAVAGFNTAIEEYLF